MVLSARVAGSALGELERASRITWGSPRTPGHSLRTRPRCQSEPKNRQKRPETVVPNTQIEDLHFRREAQRRRLLTTSSQASIAIANLIAREAMPVPVETPVKLFFAEELTPDSCQLEALPARLIFASVPAGEVEQSILRQRIWKAYADTTGRKRRLTGQRCPNA